MRQILFVTVAFLAGLSIGLFARTAMGKLQRKDLQTTDLAAIDKLHEADVVATLTQDPSALTALWSDDGVNLGFPCAPVVGIKAMREAYAKFRADYPDFQVLRYAPNIKDLQVANGWAIEVINGESMYKLSAKGNPVTVKGEALRVLKRQSDGSWKFALVGLK
jgi:ketosteroid isomerase-like protein